MCKTEFSCVPVQKTSIFPMSEALGASISVSGFPLGLFPALCQLEPRVLVRNRSKCRFAAPGKSTSILTPTQEESLGARPALACV